MRKILLPLFLYCFLASHSQSFTCGTSTVTDVDGNTYHSVLIGSQCWMKENMKTTRYSNGQLVGINGIRRSGIQQYSNMAGKIEIIVKLSSSDKLHLNIIDMGGRLLLQSDIQCSSGDNLFDISIGPAGLYIVQIKSSNTESNFKVMGSNQNTIGYSLLQNTPSQFKNASDTIVLTHMSRYCFDYDNDPVNTDNFGKLYTSLSALNTDSIHYVQPVQGVCPNNWHVPSDEDWIQLEITAGMDSIIARYSYETFRGTIANKLKTSDSTDWEVNYGTDDFGFSAKGSGMYWTVGSKPQFNSLKQESAWWTYRIDGGFMELMNRLMTGYSSGIYRGFPSGFNAYSVRCMKNN